jgi:hypothetical protein
MGINPGRGQQAKHEVSNQGNAPSEIKIHTFRWSIRKKLHFYSHRAAASWLRRLT